MHSNNSKLPARRRLHPRSRGRRSFLALASTGLVGGIALRLDQEARGQASNKARFVYYNHCNSMQTTQLNKSMVSTPSDFELRGFMTEFEPHRADLTVVQRMHCQPGNYLHGNAHSAMSCTQRGDNTGAFGGGAGITDKLIGGATIDQVIANHLHDGERLRSLVLGHAQATRDANCTQGTIIGSAEDRPIYPTIDPVAAHESVFGVGGQDEVLVALEQSYLDFVKDDIQAFNQQLPSFERQKFEQYLESVRELERSLATGLSGASCPNVEAQRFPNAEEGTTRNHPAYWNYMADLAVAAMQCGATRQVTMLHSFGCIHLRYTFDGATKNDHQEVCHKEEDGPFRENVLRFHAETLVHMYDRLKQIPEGSGTMADNTLMVWSSDGGGKHHRGNSTHNMVFLGRGNGALQGERWVKLGGGDYPLGSAHLTSALTMGLELETFGDGTDDVDRPIAEVLS